MVKKYENLDGLRAIAAIGIVLMHVLANGKFLINSNIITDTISKAGIFVQLFFIISGFGMCCGYYDRIKNNRISINDFYKKRYQKILPYFALLVLIDVVMSGFKVNSLIEGFCDLTLFYGFFSTANIEVIGVGWALGAIFAFYCLFPFVVFLLWNKRRAWLSFVLSIVVYYICTYYFEANAGCNVSKWMCYFIAGGIIYLYREGIEGLVSKHRIIMFLITVALTLYWLIMPSDVFGIDILVIKTLLMFVAWICYSISVKSIFLTNKITGFLSSISFEIYLCHMMVFRVIEKLKLLHITNIPAINYIFVGGVTLVGAIVFSVCAKIALSKIKIT